MKVDIHRIELCMAEQGLSQRDLATISGVSRQNICNLLGRGRCLPATAGKLARALGVPVAEIIINS